MNKFLTIIFVLCFSLQVHAFEDYIITTKGKLTDISIEDNTIVDVYPIITLMNNKNTLMVSPLKTGKTRVCVLKNGKDKIMFNIEVQENKTFIDNVENFEILSLDQPEDNKFVLDEPPTLKGEQ